MTARRTPPGDLRRPTAAQAEFLVACLDQGERGKAAFDSWLGAAGDPLTRLRDPALSDRNLFALLHRARRDQLPRAVAPVLHAAVVHEQLRAEAVGAAGAEVVTALQTAGYEPILTGGAALAWGRYEEPWLRHCHNVDLAVDDAGEARNALGAMVERGRHPSGTPVSIVPSDPATLAAFADPVDLAGARVPAHGAADQLVQLCANAAARFDPGLRPFADGWTVCAGAAVDWERVERLAAAASRTAPVSTLLEWLAEHGGPEAPAELRRNLARSRRAEVGRALVVTGPSRVRNRLRRAWRA